MQGLSRHNDAALSPTTAWLAVPTAMPIALIGRADAGFPAGLSGLKPRVAQLWVVGRLPDPDQPLLAVVGARAASTAGCRRAAALAGAAAGAGFGIVSGGALGIDAAAHAGALNARGATFAVLGCGVDVVYPDRHARLFADIAATGGLLSDFPPGTPPRSRQFPSRNRIVAGLARAVLVVEARLGSGALITARLAREMGRPLFAVPGTPGTDGLIAAGEARPFSDEAQLLRALRGEEETRPVRPDRFQKLLAALCEGPIRPAELALKLGHDLPDTLALIAEAALEGWISRLPGGAIASLEG
jgi:DNA processing protein